MLTPAERQELRRRIDEESRKRVPARASADRALERYAKKGLPRMSVAAVAAVANAARCKTAGCTNAPNTRYDRGLLAGYCEELCIPRRRAEASARAGGDASKWATAEAVVEAIKVWARENGEFPTSTQFTGEDERFPSYNTVRRFFPSWSSALEAAGCPAKVSSGLVRVESDGRVVVLENMRAEVVADIGAGGPVPEDAPALEASPDPLANAAEELEAAFEDYERAGERFAAAINAFQKHPTYRAIADVYGWDDEEAPMAPHELVRALRSTLEGPRA